MHALPPPCHPGTDRKPPVPVRRSFPQARAAVEGSGIPAVRPSSPPWLLPLLRGISSSTWEFVGFGRWLGPRLIHLEGNIQGADREESSRVADRNPLAALAHGHTLAEAIVDSVREPLVVLDRDLRVIAASRSFYRTFSVEPQN